MMVCGCDCSAHGGGGRERVGLGVEVARQLAAVLFSLSSCCSDTCTTFQRLGNIYVLAIQAAYTADTLYGRKPSVSTEYRQRRQRRRVSSESASQL